MSRKRIDKLDKIQRFLNLVALMRQHHARESVLAITLESLMKKCYEDVGCLTWTGHVNKGIPQWRVGHVQHTARRVIYLLTRGSVKAGRRIGVSCTNSLCVHPDHLVARSRGQSLKGKPRSLATRAKLVAKAQANGAMPMETVREIRSSAESSKAIAARMGLNRHYVKRIQSNRVRKDYSSPWANLLQRAA